jgi:hypothetical protein
VNFSWARPRVLLIVAVAMTAAAIGVAVALGSSVGPSAPSAVSSVTGIGTVAWSNAANAEASDDAWASASLGSGVVSNYLEATGFGFAIPAGSTITGVTVSVERSASGTSDIRDQSLRLLKASALAGTDRADTLSSWPHGTDASASYGSSSDLWGTTLTASDVNASGFGVALSAKNNAGSANFARVDQITITVSYTTGGGGGGTAPANTVSPTDSGLAVQSKTLVAGHGAWSGTSPISYGYQWRRCNSSGASCVDISGATSTGYTVAAADVSHTLRVHVTATNSAGSATADSAATPVVLSSSTGFEAVGSSNYGVLYNPSAPYTAWLGAWIDPLDGSLWAGFTQSSGTQGSGTPQWVQDRLGDPTWTAARDHWDLTNETLYETSTDHGSTWSLVNTDGTSDMTTPDATGAPGSSSNCTSSGNGSGCPTYTTIPYTPQADIALSDGTLIRRVNGEDIKYDQTFSATAFLQRLAPGATSWSGIQYVLDPSSCSCTEQISRIRQLSDGRLIALGEWWSSLPGQPHGTAHHLLAVSSNEGVSWTSALSIGAGVTEPAVNEWDVAELPDGDLLAVFRTAGSNVPVQGLLTKSGSSWTLTDVTTTPFAHSGHPELLATSEGAILYITEQNGSQQGIWVLSNSSAESDGNGWTLLPFTATGTNCVAAGSNFNCSSDYYPRSFEDPYSHTIYVFSHHGADDPYPPSSNEEIIKQSFTIQATP